MPRSMFSKRPLSADETDVSDLMPSQSVTVHGIVVGQLSPIKTSKKK